MSNAFDTQSSRINCPGTAVKLIRAAALAAALVPVGSVIADAAAINCVTSFGSGSGECEAFGEYVAGGNGTNTWKFFSSSTYTQENLLYTLEITGVPQTNFKLDVTDVVTTQGSLADGTQLDQFPGAECITTFDTTRCGLFDVFLVEGDAENMWDENGYYMTIRWLSSASQPPDDGSNRILRAGDYFNFEEALRDPTYDPDPDPTDPALGGRGDSFSRFGAFQNVQNVPEPSTILLLGAGVVTALYRRKRRPS